jgi:ABC-type Fe3+ transport system substrate-binding protein
LTSVSQQAAAQTASIAAFDRAYEDFLAAFAQAPDAALPYVPPGEDYALGVLPMHLLDPMHHYMGVLELIEETDYAPLDLATTSEAEYIKPERHAEITAARPTGADRARMLAELEMEHQRVRQRAAALDPVTFARQALVIYPPAPQPYPTSCRDILDWLTDHYNEHVAQVGTLLADWRASQGVSQA